MAENTTTDDLVAFYDAVFNMTRPVIEASEQETAASGRPFTEESVLVRRSIARQVRNGVEEIDMTRFNALYDVDNVIYWDLYAVARDNAPAIGTEMPDDLTLSLLSGKGLTANNPVVEWMSDMTGIPTDQLLGLWLSHLLGKDISGEVSCAELCDLMAAFDTAMNIEGVVKAAARCFWSFVPAAIIGCVAIAVGKAATRQAAITKRKNLCLASCLEESNPAQRT